jgi:D-alanine transaminase
MTRIAYTNGMFVPHDYATVSMDDRGYHFADSVYEVIAYNQRGFFVDGKRHLDRLRSSLKALNIPFRMSDQALFLVMHELVRKNRHSEGYVYLQITRGIAPRDHLVRDFLEPTLAMFAEHCTFQETPPHLKVFTVPDIRWKRNDIKSTSLLGVVVGKYQAANKGGDEAWLVNDEGFVTEGGATNAWIVTHKGVVQTHPATNAILNGITRQRLIEIAKDVSIVVEEKPFTVEDAKSAREAFLTSSTKGVHPIIEIDDQKIGNGLMGDITQKLQKAYWHFYQHTKNDYGEIS